MSPHPPRKVLTPGSYPTEQENENELEIEPEKEKATPKKAGRPSKAVKIKRVEKCHRESCTQEDMMAIRLVKYEDHSIAQASLVINRVKKNVVPRMTLSDRLRTRKRSRCSAGHRSCQELWRRHWWSVSSCALNFNIL